MRRELARLTFAVAASVALAGPVLAQYWPTRPVTLIVPSSAGGTPDVLGRVLAQKLTELLGQQVLVVDRPGAAGISVRRRSPGRTRTATPFSSGRS